MMNSMQVFSVLFALLGLAMGSFGNVLIFRIRSNESIFGRSHCMSCKRSLTAIDLVPVLSYLLLGGRCRRCKKEISAQYPLVEAASAAVFLFALALRPEDPLGALLVAIVLYFLLLAAVYDYLYQQIPDAFTWLIALFAVVDVIHSGGEYGSAILGAAVALGWFGAQWLLTKGRAVGSGDIFLATAIGLWLGLRGSITMLILSYMVGAVVLLVLLATKTIPRSRLRIAFAPFIGIATLLTVAGAGEWYLSFLQ